MHLKAVLRKARQWFFKTPERALDQAYEAALMIQTIERDYFEGNPISSAYGNYGQSAQAYFRGELRKYLNIIKLRMTEFKTSSSVLRVSDPKIMEIQVSDHLSDDFTVDVIDKPAIFFRKLRFVDEVVARYERTAEVTQTSALTTVSEPTQNGRANNSSSDRQNSGNASHDLALTTGEYRQSRSQAMAITPTNQGIAGKNGERPKQNAGKGAGEALSNRTSFLPRSILRTVDRIRQELNPQAELEVVKNFRSSKVKTTVALKFVLLMIIVPLLTQQFSKNFVVSPVIDWLRGETQAEAFLNIEMEEEALHELARFEERLRFEVLIGKAPPLPEDEIEASVREKAAEIEEEYRHLSADAIKNVFADIFAAIAFGTLLTVSRRDVAMLKSFIDEIIYGLSDSAKAFIIILFTDMFVGFHSPHGWEILLEGLSRHLGLPANRDFIFLFIATFPVILDTVFKYWIFRYLNRISPSAVATYKNMNE